MKKLLISASVMLLILGTVGTAGAVPVTLDYSGEYMFTRTGNDSNDGGLEAAINNWFDDEDISYSITLDEYAKVDEPDTADGTKLTVTYDDGMQSGSWESDQNVQFYSVKGADEYALYWLGEDGASSGDWWTGHLRTPNGNNIPEISHLAVFNPTGGAPPPTDPVPEPATMLLLGSGLLGSGALARRRRKQG